MSTNPFSPHPFPFSDEDLLLFGTSQSDTNANAWAEFGQGRTVSSMMAMDMDILETPTRDTPPVNPFSPIYGNQQPPPLKGTKRGSGTGSEVTRQKKKDVEQMAEERTETPVTKRQRRDTTEVAESGDESSGGGGSGRRRASSAGDRARLTEQEKKSNHIASEQKRRMAIRDGFDRLTTIVPGLEGQGRSESIVLKKSVDHMRKILDERQALMRRLEELGGEIPKDIYPLRL